MSPLFTKTILLLTSCIASTLAISINNTFDTLQAGTQFTLKVSNDLSSSRSADKAYESYRLYLIANPIPNRDPAHGTQPACYFNASLPINTTSVTLTIPPTLLPNGPGYAFAVRPFSGTMNDNNELLVPSTLFTLTGSAIQGLSDYEAFVPTVGGYDQGDHLPCSAYDCARLCTNKYYPALKADVCAIQGATECVATCAGVERVAWPYYPSEACTKSISSAATTGYTMLTTISDSLTVVEYWTTADGNAKATGGASMTSTTGASGAVPTGNSTATKMGSNSTAVANPNSATTSGLDLEGTFLFSIVGAFTFVLAML